LEEQVAQYKKFDQEHKTKAQSERAELERTLKEGASKELEETVANLKKEAQESVEKARGEGLLLVSQFLRLAAVRRSEEYDAELEENKALEGLLAAAYAGTSAAVSTLTKLINGSNESVDLGEGQQYNVTCKSNTNLRIIFRADFAQMLISRPLPWNQCPFKRRTPRSRLPPLKISPQARTLSYRATPPLPMLDLLRSMLKQVLSAPNRSLMNRRVFHKTLVSVMVLTLLRRRTGIITTICLPRKSGFRYNAMLQRPKPV
jgi:hypothetical protein